MKKNTFITLISLIIIASLPVNVAFSHEETLETLKNKEEKILKLLSNPQVKNEKKETKVTLKKTDDDSKSKLIEVSYQNNYLKRILKRKNLRKQIAMKKNEIKNEVKKNPQLTQPIIIASNKVSEINNVNSKTNTSLIKPSLTLKNSQDSSSKKAISKRFFTISTDYFEDEVNDDENTSFVYVTNDVSLHTLPSLSSKLIYLVKANTRLKLDKNHGAWYRVKSADNKYGWILGDMINFSDPNTFSTLRNKGKGF